MKKLKYILLGASLSVFIFLASNLMFGQYYKYNMFNIDEDITFNIRINTVDKNDLSMIEAILKENAKDNFSIVVHNNSKSDIIEYNFYTNSNYQDKIITYQKVDFDSIFELRTGDGIFFDPIKTNPIIINNIDLKNISENAIVVLFNFTGDNVSNVISNLKSDLSTHNLSDTVSIEEVITRPNESDANIYLLKEHIYIFIIVIIISLLIFKDINNNFKEISLLKLEGNSSLFIYFKYVLNNIIIIILTLFISLALISFIKYNVSFKYVRLYYKYLTIHSLTSLLLLFVFTIIGYVIIAQTKIYAAIKGYNQLETSIIGLSFIKVLILIVLSLMTSNYTKTLPQSIIGLLNYQKSIEKYQDLYLINSSLSIEVNQVLEIERIKNKLSDEYNGFSTVCLPQGDSALGLEDDSFPMVNYSSIYYIVDSNKNQITIDPDRILKEFDKGTFKDYGFDSFDIVKEDLNVDEFLYCTRDRVQEFNEKLYYSDYKVIKIEVENIYDHDLKPNFILFKAENKDHARQIINEIYDELGETNQLIVESMEDNLKKSYDLEKQIVLEAITNLIIIIIVLLILNGELISNFIHYDKEENIHLHLIGKSKLYMVRKYLISNVAIILSMFITHFVLYLKYGLKINFITIIVYIILELISVIYYQKQNNYKKLRGL